MKIDPNIRFKRVLKGYDPREVDEAFDVMQSEITSLSNIIGQYDRKIQQLADSTRRLEEARMRKARHNFMRFSDESRAWLNELEGLIELVWNDPQLVVDPYEAFLNNAMWSDSHYAQPRRQKEDGCLGYFGE